ncbi:hypothetical protein ACQ4LE_011014 [Meloidogyne hapla]|uniref:AAA domain-containing protein n=1 Tax=Meloidogyne hapla TaxID=6305 RepID=A0A1I8C153_MELHA
MKLATLALFLLASLWCFSDGNGGIQPLPPSTHSIRLTSTRFPKIQLFKHRKLKPPNFYKNNRLSVTAESKRHLEQKQINSSKITQQTLNMTKYPSKSITPIIVEKASKEIEKEQKEAKERLDDLVKILKHEIHQKREERPKFARAQYARFSSGRIYVSPSVDWTGESNEEIITNLFENLPKLLQNIEVAKQASDTVLVDDEINRVLEYETAINEIEWALEDEKEKIKNKVIKNREELEVEQKDTNKGNEVNLVDANNSKGEKWKNGKGRLYHLWLKLNLFGILNISGPGDNVDERLDEAVDRLHKADTFVSLLDENNKYRMELEFGIKNCENLFKRAAKILNKFNNFRPFYFRPGSVLDKYKVIYDKKVKNKKEIFIDKQPFGGVKDEEDNWLEEKSKNIRKERGKELKHVMKSEIFGSTLLFSSPTVDWSKEFNANFVLQMVSRLSKPLPSETLEKFAVELVLVLDEAQRVFDYDTEIAKIENAIEDIKESGKNILEIKDQRLNRHLLKFTLWGVLNVEGPVDNLEKKKAQAFERLHSADEFLKFYGEDDSDRIQVEKSVKDAENVLNRAIDLLNLFDNFRGKADEKKIEQITSEVNIKKGFDEGEG